MPTFTVTAGFHQLIGREDREDVAVLVVAADKEDAMNQVWDWFAETDPVEFTVAEVATPVELATLPTLDSVQ